VSEVGKEAERKDLHIGGTSGVGSGLSGLRLEFRGMLWRKSGLVVGWEAEENKTVPWNKVKVKRGSLSRVVDGMEE
jgi:hypothetical protein